MAKTAFDEDPEPEQKDRFWVPPNERKNVDEGPDSDAMNEETGNDMDDWEPE
jgi:hypothetical protein